MAARKLVIFDVDEVLCTRDTPADLIGACAILTSDGTKYVAAQTVAAVRQLSELAAVGVYTANTPEGVQGVLDYVFDGIDLEFVMHGEHARYTDGEYPKGYKKDLATVTTLHPRFLETPMVIIDDTWLMVKANPLNQVYHFKPEVPRGLHPSEVAEITARLDSQVQAAPLVFYTDGASQGNHLPAEMRFGGIGVYAESVPWSTEPIMHSHGYRPPKTVVTNNTMELTAVLVALRAVWQRSLQASAVTIRSDSTYVIGGMKKPRGHKSNAEIWRKVVRYRDQLAARGWRIVMEKVKAHTGVIDGNYHADALAVAGAESVRP